MGRHAAPRTSNTVARRATAVSAGTFMLCLGGVAPALAATNPPPIPKPVSDAVQQVSKATGLPNPIPPSEPAPRHHRTTKQAPAATTQRSATQHVTTTPVQSRPSAAGVAVAMPTNAILTRTARLSASAPAVAAPTRITPSSSLEALPAPLTSNDAPRILLVAMATMVLGALASAHIKAAQAYVFAHGALTA